MHFYIHWSTIYNSQKWKPPVSIHTGADGERCMQLALENREDELLVSPLTHCLSINNCYFHTVYSWDLESVELPVELVWI